MRGRQVLLIAMAILLLLMNVSCRSANSSIQNNEEPNVATKTSKITLGDNNKKEVIDNGNSGISQNKETILNGLEWEIKSGEKSGAVGITMDKSKLSIGNRQYVSGLYFSQPSPKDETAPSIQIKTSKKYQRISFEVATIGGGNDKIVVSDESKLQTKDVVLKQIDISDSRWPTVVELDITSVDSIIIKVVGSEDNKTQNVIIGELKLK